MEAEDEDEIRNCLIKLRSSPERRRNKVYIGCGAGFGGDRPLAALKLLQRVKELNYLVLECLAERTLADRYQIMMSGGDGYDSRISEWMQTLLPLALERGTCIITNMGAMDAQGAQHKVLELARDMGLNVSVAVAHEVPTSISGISTYMGAAPIVECLEKYQPNVVITSRVADAALFLAPMVYELGWNWDELEHLAQGSMAGHLLECGCQLTGGYFMHPGDKYRDMSFEQLLDLSLPYAEISHDGQVCVCKAEGSGGLLNFSTCAQQLLYEIGDPSAYVTPDVDVSFVPLSSCKVVCHGAKPSTTTNSVPDKLLQLVPKVRREDVFWQIALKQNTTSSLSNKLVHLECNLTPNSQAQTQQLAYNATSCSLSPAPSGRTIPLYEVAHSRAGDKGNDINFSLIPHFGPDIHKLKQIVTPQRIKLVVAPLMDSSSNLDVHARKNRDKWVHENVKVEIYEVRGIQALNVVVRNILDGGVNCSRRVDRHGKTISDLILCQQVVLPP